MEENISRNKINKRSKIIIISIICIVLVTCIIFITIYLLKKVKKESYYTEQMKIYGLDTLYNDDNTITKIEALKVITAAVKNETDLRIIKADRNATSNEDWLDLFSTEASITNIVSKSNMNDKITIQDVLIILFYEKYKYITTNIDYDENIQLTNYDENSKIAKIALIDNIMNGIVDDKINFKKYITKGEFENIIIKFMYKYSTMVKLNKETVELEYINNNYPYLINSISNDIYELPFKYSVSDGFKSPKNSYVELRSAYSRIIKQVTSYFSMILNVDYTNFDEENFEYIVSTFSNASEEDIQKYVNFVKENNITITGSVKVIEPAIYKDNEYIYVRVKLNYKIVNSNVNNNLIFGDKNENYDIGNEYEKILDIKLKENLTFYILQDINLSEFCIK